MQSSLHQSIRQDMKNGKNIGATLDHEDEVVRVPWHIVPAPLLPPNPLPIARGHFTPWMPVWLMGTHHGQLWRRAGPCITVTTESRSLELFSMQKHFLCHHPVQTGFSSF